MAVSLSRKITIHFKTDSRENNFFGYYDKPPLNVTGNKLLAHRTRFDGRDIGPNDTAEIGYWDISSNTFVSLGTTRAFNWQQGAMLQWLPPDYNSKIIYNDRTEDSFISVILDIRTREKKIIPSSIYTVHPSGKFALGVNYEHFYFCRPGYNYQGVVNPKWDKYIHEEDGIFSIDLEGGKVDLLISTRQICNTNHLPEMEHAYNWLEHMVWNPSGTRFAFLHRWQTKNGGHVTRLFTANADGSDIFMFPHSGFYSHMGWRNDQEFTIWGNKVTTARKVGAGVDRHETLRKIIWPGYRFLKKTFLRKSLERMLPTAAYLECWDRTGRVEVLNKGVLTNDGHNSWSKDERWMLTDTYEDAQSYRHLLLYDSQKNELIELGRFYSPYNECAYRCDLHPRFDHSEKYVVIDSAHQNGKRQMYVLNISEIFE